MWRYRDWCIVLKSEPWDDSLQWSVSTTPSLNNNIELILEAQQDIVSVSGYSIDTMEEWENDIPSHQSYPEDNDNTHKSLG